MQVQQDMNGPDYRPNSAQQLLAEEVTRFVHGQPGLNEAIRATQARPFHITHLLLQSEPWAFDDEEFYLLDGLRVLARQEMPWWGSTQMDGLKHRGCQPTQHAVLAILIAHELVTLFSCQTCSGQIGKKCCGGTAEAATALAMDSRTATVPDHETYNWYRLWHLEAARSWTQLPWKPSWMRLHQ